MSWTLSLFAGAADEIASRLKSDTDLLALTLQHIRANASVTDNDLAVFRDLLSAGLNGQWVADGTTDSLDALCWLLDFVSESVTPSQIQCFKSISLLEDTGLLKYFRAEDSPFPLPRTEKLAGLCGVLLNSKMAAVLHGEEQLEDPPDQNTRMFRTLLLDLIESLLAERLDLFLVLK